MTQHDTPTSRESWHMKAACAGSSPELFYPRDEDDPQQTAAARALCSSCPVADRCLADALTRPTEIGIWAGTSTHDRKRLRAPSFDELAKYVLAHRQRGRWQPAADDVDIVDVVAAETGIDKRAVREWVKRGYVGPIHANEVAARLGTDLDTVWPNRWRPSS